MPSSARKTRVVVCGEKRIAEACLRILYACGDTDICAIVASPRDWQADLIAWGVAHRTKVYVGNVNRYVDEIKRLEPDFIFSIQYRRLLRPEILAVPHRGCINLHFGLLPRYGGCYPVAWAILNGESQAGATLHYMTERFDEGDVIAQCSVPVRPHTTARALFDALSEAGAALFQAQYPLLRRSGGQARPQEAAKRLYYGKHSIDFERDRWIHWQRGGVEVQRQICAFTFEPFQLPATGLQGPDGQYRTAMIARTRLGEGQAPPSCAAGSILSVTPSGSILVVTGDGTLLEMAMLNQQPARDFIASLGWDPRRVRLVSGRGEGA
ncbi:methionyl-tRNA formyltransferase [Candidatus Entotheonella palauensis]|uniref:methionyl-tRNA formyltransferase n=1 Tax=Candidatus Entotheonella palauensis TaxID=93172 RepID=UPI000B7EA7EC|nr:formyltransferase family protein [Candidatus Entotheonella palauensis]